MKVFIGMSVVSLSLLFVVLFALGGGFSKTPIVASLPSNVVPYKVSVDRYPYYASDYELSAGSVVLRGYYTPAGWARGDKWVYHDETKVFLSGYIEIVKR